MCGPRRPSSIFTLLSVHCFIQVSPFRLNWPCLGCRLCACCSQRTPTSFLCCPFQLFMDQYQLNLLSSRWRSRSCSWRSTHTSSTPKSPEYVLFCRWCPSVCSVSLLFTHWLACSTRFQNMSSGIHRVCDAADRTIIREGAADVVYADLGLDIADEGLGAAITVEDLTAVTVEKPTAVQAEWDTVAAISRTPPSDGGGELGMYEPLARVLKVRRVLGTVVQPCPFPLFCACSPSPSCASHPRVYVHSAPACSAWGLTRGFTAVTIATHTRMHCRENLTSLAPSCRLR